MAKAIGSVLVPLIVGGNEAKAIKMNERQANFQIRALAAGMPTTYFAHERSGDVVAASSLDGTEHAVFVKGKKVKTATSKTKILEHYYALRDPSTGGRTAAEYVDHFGNNVDKTTIDANASARFTKMTADGIKHQGRIIRASRPATTKKVAATPKVQPAPVRKVNPAEADNLKSLPRGKRTSK